MGMEKEGFEVAFKSSNSDSVVFEMVFLLVADCRAARFIVVC